MDRCRLCSQSEGSMIDVLDNEDINSKLKSYVSLDIEKYDGFPSSICMLCYGKIDNFHNFVTNIRKVQAEFTAHSKETHSVVLENDDQFEKHPFNYHDFKSETKYNPHCNTVMDEEVPVKKSRKRRSILETKPTRKSNRCKITPKHQSSMKDACIQAGTTLQMDLDDLRSNLSFKFRNLEGLEILALLPERLKVGRSISQDSETSKSCLAKLNLGAKTKKGEILMASASNSKQLIKLPPPRISK